VNATEPASPAQHQLEELYGRYRTLALASGAALTLGAPPAALADEVRALRADAHAAAESTERFAPQLSACAVAAGQLVTLLETSSDEQLDAVRVSHKRLRRDVWDLVPCDYTPCCLQRHHSTDRSNGG
jgi:hypothetical protein